jgi:Xaa-Pro aminopeptidase
VLVDFGLRKGGYCTDCCRMLWLEEKPPEQAELYAWLQELQEEILGQLQPGRRSGEVDAWFRARLEEEGRQDHCPHALGHGVGLQIHEAPYLRRGATDKLEPGMVVSVEPGIYLPGRYGIRVEDMALITEQGGVWLRDIEGTA